jgi:hypothetical protein
MLPKVLAPEVFPYSSIEVIPADAARVPDCPTCDGYAFVGHVCPGEFDADQDEIPGSRCSWASCGDCGRCS